MADPVKVSDQYHRSRLTTLTASSLLFLISTATSKTHGNLKPFGMDVGPIDHNFTIVSLAVFSLVSLVSLHLIYKDDVDAFLISRQSNVEIGDLQNTKRLIDEAIRNNQQLVRQYSALISSDRFLQTIAIAPTMVDPEKIPALIQRCIPVETLEPFNNLERTLSILHQRNEISDNLESSIRMAAQELRQGFHENRQRVEEWFNENSLEQRWSTSELMDVNRMNKSLVRNSDSLGSISRQLELHVKGAKLAILRRKVEYTWIGLYAPTALFGLALVHAFGALFGGWFPTLPELVNGAIAAVRG